MEDKNALKYSIQLSFEEIRLPPFEDILLLGKRCPQGKIGVCTSMNLLIPNEFQVIEIEDDNVEAVVINKRILKKMEIEKVLQILKEKVFPYVSDTEVVKVDLKVKVFYDLFEGEF